MVLSAAPAVGGGPVNTVAPQLTPAVPATIGVALTCSQGTWTGNPTITYSYQFFRGGSTSVLGPGSTTGYTTVSADVGSTITCKVTATNSVTSAVASSNVVSVGAALNTHAIGAAGVSSATSAPVTLAGVVSGTVITGFYFYCGNSGCNGGAAVTPSSITGTLGDTCTYSSAASIWNTGTSPYGIGAFSCTGMTSSGSDTVTVTMPSAVFYLQLWVQSWTGATKVDTACSKAAIAAVSQTTWSITSGTAAVTATAPVSFVAPLSAGTTTTNGTILDNDGNGRITSYLPTQTTTGPFTMNGTNVSSPINVSILCASP